MAGGAALRVVLYGTFHAGAFSTAALALGLAAGTMYDALVAWLVFLPALLALVLLPLSLFRFRGVRFFVMGLFGGALTFALFIEYFFFEEYNARFNHIALDYLLHPKEVLGNIWESYDVPLFVALAGLVGVALGAAAVRMTRGVRFDRLSRGARTLLATGAIAAGVVAAAGLDALPSDVSPDRIVSEIAQNGIDRLVHAFRTGSLDYSLYYRSLPIGLARRRAAAVLGFPPISGAEAARDDFRFVRPTGADDAPPARDWDVVVILEESFGSEFVGVLGHPERRSSPGFDRWSREGILFTNLTANGNRTVRGLEGTLSSLVPLPGASILRRARNGRALTLAEILRRRGYRTAFFYGGWGRFDDMKPFYPENGFEEFHERDAYPRDAFATIWGVADEVVFDRVLARQREAASRGERLFATVLTTSNHKPFDVPERGTAWPADLRNRDSAVAYADWALASYLDRARSEGLLEHTLVLLEGDHGARVYGAEEIPVASYRIPGLLLVPDPAWSGRRIERLVSQIDLAPTILGLLGIRSAAPLLGEDVTGLPADGGRAFVLHNREVGMLTDGALVTLGLQGRTQCYRRDGRESDVFHRIADCATDPEMQRLEDDAAAVFQTADDLVRRGAYTLPLR